MTTHRETGATASAVLKAQLTYNSGALAANIADVKQEESLVQPDRAGNCINWVVGHIVANRNALLGLVGRAPIWSEQEAQRYQRGGDPIDGPGEGVHDLSKIITDFNTSQEELLAGLESMTAADLEVIVPSGGGGADVGTAIAGLVFHEAYHLGQIGLLRRIIGKEGAIR